MEVMEVTVAQTVVAGILATAVSLASSGIRPAVPQRRQNQSRRRNQSILVQTVVLPMGDLGHCGQGM
jgi:Flp pilus assembly protein CpaB